MPWIRAVVLRNGGSPKAPRGVPRGERGSPRADPAEERGRAREMDEKRGARKAGPVDCAGAERYALPGNRGNGRRCG